jgi:F-type H+-transporting ATPase subunit a
MIGPGMSKVVVQLGPVAVTSTVVTTWCIMAALAAVAWILTRRLSLEPGRAQTVVEATISLFEETIAAVLPDHAREVLPFVGTLWVFVVAANLAGVVPGFESPTADLSATAAFAVLVFLSVHAFGIRIQGARRYLLHYLRPNPLLLPFHILSELTRTLALAVRLFGNMMSLDLAALVVLMVAGFLVPVPILMLHIVEALVQAYIFGMLALIYIAGGVQSGALRNQTKEE